MGHELLRRPLAWQALAGHLISGADVPLRRDARGSGTGHFTRQGGNEMNTTQKVVAAIAGVVVLLALCAGAAFVVTNQVNAHNLAVQRAAAAASHNRAVASAKASAQAKAIADANAKAAKAAKAAAQARRAARRAANRPAPAPVVVVPAAPAAPPEGSTQPGSQSGGLQATGIGTQGEEVYSNSATSTAFAMQVESDYWNAPGMTFTSYSSVTGQSYFMTAVDDGTTVTVTNDVGCVIQFGHGDLGR